MALHAPHPPHAPRTAQHTASRAPALPAPRLPSPAEHLPPRRTPSRRGRGVAAAVACVLGLAAGTALLTPDPPSAPMTVVEYPPPDGPVLRGVFR